MPDVIQENILKRTSQCLRLGVSSGLHTATKLLILMAPISFVVAVLTWTGILGIVAKWISPLFRFLGLPGEAAFVFLTGVFLNIYSAIAAMGPLDLSSREVTIIAIMLLTAHNLPIEAAVQHKAGTSGLRLLVMRLVAAMGMAAVFNVILPEEASARAVSAALAASSESPELAAALKAWAGSTIWLVGKIILIIMGVTTLQRFLDEFRIMPKLSRLLAWPLAGLGLPQQTVFLWLVANTLGLAFGGAILIEEARLKRLTEEQLQILNCSIAVCHSLLEDTMLFLAIGASSFWITVPRLVLAGVVVWGYRLLRQLGSR